MSDVAVMKQLKNKIKPWFIAKPSAQLVAKMEDVLAVYKRPYDMNRNAPWYA